MVFVGIPCHMQSLHILLITVTTFVIIGLIPGHELHEGEDHVCLSSLPLYLQDLVQCLAGGMHLMTICEIKK